MPSFCWFDHFLYSRTEICQIFCCFFGKFKIIKMTFWNWLTFIKWKKHLSKISTCVWTWSSTAYYLSFERCLSICVDVAVTFQFICTHKFPYAIFTCLEMAFCYQNCSDLLWEKIVIVIKKNFWNSRLKAENLPIFWDH